MATRVANTKHFKVSKLLSEKIRFMLPGELLPTVMELQKQYKASQATITQAIDRLRVQGLVERPPGKKRLVIARIGSRPKLKITLIRPLWASPDYDSITNRIYEMGYDEHYGFNVHIYNDVNQLNIEHALHQSDAGLIIGDLNMDAKQVGAINSSRKPIVFLRDKPPASNADSIWVDDVAVGQAATDHLLKLGHKRIAVMLSEPYNPSSSARLHGWKKRLIESGCEDAESLIIDCSVKPGKDAMIGSYEKLSHWLETSRMDFTAIFCVAWTGALAALRALRERGVKVPEQVSIVTYASESPLCDFTAPALTTVQVDLERYTREAIRLVRENLNQDDTKKTVKDIKLDPHIVIRGSTAVAPVR